MPPTCPECADAGQPLRPETVEAFAPNGVGAWWRCRSPGCDVIYFSRDVPPLRRAQAQSVPYDKATDPDPMVCFCFGHRVSDLRADRGLREAIKAACAAGRDDCARTNPKGRCCLGDVGEVLGEATRASCCGGG